MFLNRIGLVFVVNDSEDVDGLQDCGVALLRAYNYVAQEVDNNHAFQLVISVSIPLQKHCCFVCMSVLCMLRTSFFLQSSFR